MVHRVEFSDTDMAGIIHFSSFFRYMEVTEHAFFRSLGFSVVTEHEGRKYGWPRVHVECDFKRPVRFEDDLEVELIVREKRDRLLRYQFDIRKVGDEATGLVAQGGFTVVCVEYDAEQGRMRAVPIPAALAGLIQEAE
jgi:YbgC/YbaW family acyl-CoA thioester hydrolase